MKSTSSSVFYKVLSRNSFKKYMRCQQQRAEMHCIKYEDIESAYNKIHSKVHFTPLMTCKTIDKLAGRECFLKTENLQKTGSFKIRGAMNSITLALEKIPDLCDRCVVTHSSGNHGQAIACASQILGVPSYIIMPNNAPQCKKDAVKGYGGCIVECLPTEQSRVETCEKVRQKYDGVFIDASQNPGVMAGQGTMALEILKANSDIDAIVAPVGGGGMISGIAVAAKHVKSSILVYAAEPEMANDCYISKQTGVKTANKSPPQTIADGVKVSIGANAWPIIRDVVDDVITVSEEEIKQATKLVWERSKLVIEPTSGVGVAAVIHEKFNHLKGMNDSVKKVAIVLCGGNCDISVVGEMLRDVTVPELV